MTELMALLREFLSSPLGTLLVVVLGGAATYMASTFKAKGDASKQIEASRAEAAQLLNEREAQNLADREAIRQLFIKGQARIDALVAGNEALEQKLDEAQAQAKQAQADADSARSSAATCAVQVAELRAQVDSAQSELHAKTVELEDRLRDIVGLREQNNVLISSNYDLMQANEVNQRQLKEMQEQLLAKQIEVDAERAKNGHLQEEVATMQTQIETLKAQVAALQAKVGTDEHPDDKPSESEKPHDA